MTNPETPKPPLEGEKQSIRDSMIEAAKANNVEYDPTKLKDATPDIKVGLADRWIAKAVNNDPEKARNVYKALGIDIASTDDAGTVERFKKFQIENNLEPDGIPGPLTLELIDRLTWDKGNFDKQLYAADGSPYSAEKEEAMANLNSPSGTLPTTDNILWSAPQNNFTNSTVDSGSLTFQPTTELSSVSEEKEVTEEEKKDKNTQLLWNIEGAVKWWESEEYIQGYISQLSTDHTISQEQITALNKSIKDKGYQLIDKTPGWALEKKDKTESEKTTDGLTSLSNTEGIWNKKIGWVGEWEWFNFGANQTFDKLKISDLDKVNDLDQPNPDFISWDQVKILKNLKTELEWSSDAIKDMPLSKYIELRKNPLKAAQEFATNKPGKLPGGLGEYGVKYQRNEATKTVFAYRGDSEVPKILTADNKEVDIRDDIKNRWTLSEIDLGNNKTIVWTETQGKWTYELKEKKSDGTIATRKIKEDGRLENPTEGTLASVTEDR